MRRTTLFILMVLLSGLVIAQEAPKHKYVGVDKCKGCHKGVKKGKQYEIWKESKHAKAYEALKSEKAAQIAKEKGLKVPAYEAPECLKCHVTGYGLSAEFFGKKFRMEDGVQCEACHGPGSDYRKMKIMKDRAKSIENGLNPILVSDGTAEKHCRKCHNEESPTFKEFNFKEMWSKIAHPRPKKK
jgi:hypothetical protein